MRHFQDVFFSHRSKDSNNYLAESCLLVRMRRLNHTERSHGKRNVSTLNSNWRNSALWQKSLSIKWYGRSFRSNFLMKFIVEQLSNQHEFLYIDTKWSLNWMMKSRARDARSMCQNINATFSPQNQISPGIKTNAIASTQQKKRLTHPSKRSALLPHLRNQPTPQAMSLQLCSSNDTSLSIVSHCSPTTPNLHSSADSEYTDHDQSDDSQISDISHRSYRTRHSLISSSSVPTSSPDEALVRGRFFILSDSYPSSEHEDVNGIPLAFLGAEKLVRIRVDWRNVHYPLSAYHTEIIIDLFLTRPFLVREIPKVHNFSLYRPLTKTLRGWGYWSTIKLGLELAW